MDIKDLTEEQMKKARECKTTEELINLAREEGIELTDEQLDAVAGGATPTVAWAAYCTDVAAGDDLSHAFEITCKSFE